MQLIMSPASPFVRKVRVTVRELDLTDQVEEVQITTTPLQSAKEAVAANPTGKIPSLKRSDGPTLYDSRVITRFLNAKAEGTLYPEGRIWEILTLEATGDALMEAGVSMIYEERFKGTEGASGDWIEAQWGKIERAVGAVNDRWMSHMASHLNAGAIAVGCALGYLDFRMPDRDWRSKGASLADWYEGFSARPSMVDTAPS